jgi:hypothetical protein
LMLELEALNFASRLERIYEAADHKLSVCLEPIADHPQRLIDSAAGSATRMTLPELMPDGSYTALQERVLTAFSLLFVKVATYGSIVFRAQNIIGRRRTRGHISSDLLPSSPPRSDNLGSNHGAILPRS